MTIMDNLSSHGSYIIVSPASINLTSLCREAKIILRILRILRCWNQRRGGSKMTFDAARTGKLMPLRFAKFFSWSSDRVEIEI